MKSKTSRCSPPPLKVKCVNCMPKNIYKTFERYFVDYTCIMFTKPFLQIACLEAEVPEAVYQRSAHAQTTARCPL